MEQRPVVLLSGFGPFGKHAVNASWSSIQEINRELLENTHNIKIVTVEIPVIYNKVDEIVPELWKTNKPELVIHVGVSAQATKLTLETKAHGEQFTRIDCEGKVPKNAVSVCCKEENKMIPCGLDVHKIVEKYNKSNNHIPACVSSDAGRYLCEYTYYTSLSIDASRTLFVHVPDISKQLTARQLAEGLESVIGICLEQLQQCVVQKMSSA